MKKEIRKLFFILILVLFGCDRRHQNEINLATDEIFVYYDDIDKKYNVLRSGKHKYSTKYFTSRFSLKETNIQDRLLVETKDKKKLILDLTFRYSIKENAVVEIHQKYGNGLEQKLILPNIRYVSRMKFKNLLSDSLEMNKISDSIIKTIRDMDSHSKLIKSKTIIINELKFEK
mgnify:FL=1